MVGQCLVRELFTTPEDLAVRVATSISRYLQQNNFALNGIKELIAVLDLRKDAVVRMMDDAKQRALKAFRSGYGRRQDYTSVKELASHLEAIKTFVPSIAPTKC